MFKWSQKSQCVEGAERTNNLDICLLHFTSLATHSLISTYFLRQEPVLPRWSESAEHAPSTTIPSRRLTRNETKKMPLISSPRLGLVKNPFRMGNKLLKKQYTNVLKWIDLESNTNRILWSFNNANGQLFWIYQEVSSSSSWGSEATCPCWNTDIGNKIK